MSWIIVDVESNGPCPGLFSMISFGAVLLDEALETTFYGQVLPLHDEFKAGIYLNMGMRPTDHYRKPHRDAERVMSEFADWLREVCKSRPIFVSDNPAFDAPWINYYFHLCGMENPFGHSARRIGDLYCGWVNDIRKNSNWKRKLRRTPHTHHPVDDAMGNAEALLRMRDKGLNIPVGN